VIGSLSLPDPDDRHVLVAAIKRQRESLRNPPKTTEELLATLESQGLTQAVARLRTLIDLL
jgi:hypothetical protein